MLEADSTRVVPTHAGAPGALDSPHALPILSVEHWSLLFVFWAGRAIARCGSQLVVRFPTPS